MTKFGLFYLALALLGHPQATSAASKRDPAVRAEFQRLNPCPATGKKSGKCLNYNVDHRIPICFYGPDEVWNMQWLTVEEHRQKTKLDIKVCRWDGK